MKSFQQYAEEADGNSITLKQMLDAVQACSVSDQVSHEVMKKVAHTVAAVELLQEMKYEPDTFGFVLHVLLYPGKPSAGFIKAIFPTTTAKQTFYADVEVDLNEAGLIASVKRFNLSVPAIP